MYDQIAVGRLCVCMLWLVEKPMSCPGALACVNNDRFLYVPGVCVCAIQAKYVDGHGSNERNLSKCVCDKCSLDSVTHDVFEGL